MKSDTSLFKGIIAKTLVDELKSEFIGCQYYFPQKGKKNICLTVVEVKGNLFCMYLFWYAGAKLCHDNLSRAPQGEIEYEEKDQKARYYFKIVIDRSSVMVTGEKKKKPRWVFDAGIPIGEKHLPGYKP